MVGHDRDPKVEPVRTLGQSPEKAQITACKYDQLIRTAEKRLFRLKERLSERYDQISGTELLSRILSEPRQLDL